MQKEYIEREALEVALNHRLNFLMAENGEYDHYTSGFDEAVTMVENFPAPDVAPVVHGRWIEQEKYTFGVMYDCSICDNRILDNGHSWKYCPNCGCRMDGGDSDEAD